jgi:FtsH-binding integral membrane protein
MLGLFAWVVALVVLVKESKKRLKTTLYVLTTMALTVCLGLGSTKIFPTVNPKAIGLATRYTMLLVGALTAVVHSRKSRA